MLPTGFSRVNLSITTCGHLVCQDIVEVIIVLIYIALGFAIANKGGDADLDNKTVHNDNNDDVEQFVSSEYTKDNAM
jgi:hypothetical protein